MLNISSSSCQDTSSELTSRNEFSKSKIIHFKAFGVLIFTFANFFFTNWAGETDGSVGKTFVFERGPEFRFPEPA